MCFQFFTQSVSQSRVQTCLYFGLYLRNKAFYTQFDAIRNICFTYKYIYIYTVFALYVVFVNLNISFMQNAKFLIIFPFVRVSVYNLFVRFSIYLSVCPIFNISFCFSDLSITLALWRVRPCFMLSKTKKISILFAPNSYLY